MEVISDGLHLISLYQQEVWSVALVIVGVIVSRIFRLKPKLHYSIGHAADILVDEPLMGNDGNQVAPRQIVRTASITLQNPGLQAAHGVEVTFNWKPQFMSMNPARSYVEIENPHARHTLRFDSLAPNESVTVEIMSINNELPLMTAVRSDDCVSKMISMAPQRVWSPWFINSMGIMLIMGLVTTVFLVISAVKLFIS